MDSRRSAGGPSAYIIDAVRTPVGRRNGGLSRVHPADLAAVPIAELVRRTGVDPHAIDDVILGCLEALGPQAANIARTAALLAGLPAQVPGTTVDRQCGSAQQALHFAAMGVMSGVQDLVIAGGVQNMSAVPMGSANVAAAQFGFPDPWTTADGWVERYGPVGLDQFVSSDEIAAKWDISRGEMEAFAVRSHQRALAAQAAGYFDSQLVPVGNATRDEGPRAPDLGKIRSLSPLREGGLTTAALASQISDGAAAVLVAGDRALSRLGLRPRARIHYMTVIGDDPVLGLTAPIPATARALEQTGLGLSDIDLFEINEAFASVALAWIKEFGVDEERVNVNGGAIALGHPLGATGARLMTTLLSELERRGGRYGLQVMCEGGGTANLTIIERAG
jgi:acetyl-CoA C-acetyltransferase